MVKQEVYIEGLVADRQRSLAADEGEAAAELEQQASFELQFERESSAKLVIVGNYSDGETPKMGAERALNARNYLTEDKGIDANRIEPRMGAATGRTATNTFVPAGAPYNPGGTTAIPSPDVNRPSPQFCRATV